MKKYFLIVGIVLISEVKFCYGADDYGAPYLLVYPGVRQSAMGEVFTAISDDAMATFYNDAGMAFQSRPDGMFMHANLLPGLYPGMHYFFLSYVHPIKTNALGIQVVYLTSGKTEGTNDYGQKIGNWTTWGNSVKLSYAKKVTTNVSFGIGAKFIYSFITPIEVLRQFYRSSIRYEGTGTTVGFDLSSLYTPNKQISIGVSFQNLGPDIEYIESGTSHALPYMLRLGVAYYPLQTKNHSLVVGVDLTKVLVGITEEFKITEIWEGIGGEYMLHSSDNKFAIGVRGGYFLDIEGERKGFGFGFGGRAYGFKFDVSRGPFLMPHYFLDAWGFAIGYGRGL